MEQFKADGSCESIRWLLSKRSSFAHHSHCLCGIQQCVPWRNYAAWLGHVPLPSSSSRVSWLSEGVEWWTCLCEVINLCPMNICMDPCFVTTVVCDDLCRVTNFFPLFQMTVMHLASTTLMFWGSLFFPMVQFFVLVCLVDLQRTPFSLILLVMVLGTWSIFTIDAICWMCSLGGR